MTMTNKVAVCILKTRVMVIKSQDNTSQKVEYYFLSLDKNPWHQQYIYIKIMLKGSRFYWQENSAAKLMLAYATLWG